MATLTNTNKKASKIAEVKSSYPGSFHIELGDWILGWSKNGTYDEAVCFHTMRKGEKSDAMTDYFPQTWHDNFTQAYRFLKSTHRI
jgi:hypothetical protein